MRRFLRHSSNLPVELRLRRHSPSASQRLDNISLGGAGCRSSQPLPQGTPVTLHIPLLGEQVAYPGQVAWCTKQSEHYLLGVAFSEHAPELRARMVEDICNLERFRQHREQQAGQILPLELIAEEWREQRLAIFPPSTP
ncbi:MULTISPECIES: PilZ domain-containing protein [unclassified Pseudomonas]|uniref:PilZ domain-containing protein n=1 Tax=unclassified Pseudomonas TaxID=196821 RepID=UPI000967CDDF|nr:MULTISPECIES: PilZ domain-containing protein [unclassified Pseudomonas]OLU16762.1 pilus assembly protein PilZ [Pseudomonas sp. PA1(2017)]OLU35939.1 pilus assembly protein PilZ [Pseudomonas sp. PA27(2017)]